MTTSGLLGRFSPIWMALQTPVPLSARAPPPAKSAAPKPALPKTGKPAAPIAAKREYLNNSDVTRMLAAGLDEETVIGAIQSSKAIFVLDTDNLIRLKQAKVPPAVLRAMLSKNAAAIEASAVPPPAANLAANEAGPKLSIPRAELVAAIAAPPDRVTARQGAAVAQLENRTQKVLFIKSEANDAKTAIANLLLSDVGVQFRTMGLSTQMSMWHPTLGTASPKPQTSAKVCFKIATLPGLTADVTPKEARTELLVPLTRYLASADLDPATFEPALLKLDPHAKDQSRVLSGRKVLIKQEKKNRFDIRPANERQESNVEQNLVPITVERLPGNVFKMTTKGDLKRGGYALVFRKKDAAGAYTANVALKPDASPDASGPPGAPNLQPGI